MNPGRHAEANRWQSFVAFWFLAGLTLLIIGIATFAAVRHAHRVGALIALLGILCLAVGVAVGLIVRHGGRQTP